MDLLKQLSQLYPLFAALALLGTFFTWFIRTVIRSEFEKFVGQLDERYELKPDVRPLKRRRAHGV